MSYDYRSTFVNLEHKRRRSLKYILFPILHFVCIRRIQQRDQFSIVRYVRIRVNLNGSNPEETFSPFSSRKKNSNDFSSLSLIFITYYRTCFFFTLHSCDNRFFAPFFENSASFLSYVIVIVAVAKHSYLRKSKSVLVRGGLPAVWRARGEK